MPDSPVRFEADFLAFGGTEVAIFAAVRAARCGLQTVLLSQSEYPFGAFPSLGAWETHYRGCRARLSHEVQEKIIDYYRQTFGKDSARVKGMPILGGQQSHGNLRASGSRKGTPWNNEGRTKPACVFLLPPFKGDYGRWKITIRRLSAGRKSA